MAAYSTLSSQIGAMGGTEFGSALMTAAVIAVVSLALVTVTLLVGGIATIVGKRWGGWILVAAFIIGILGQLQQLASVGVGQAVGSFMGGSVTAMEEGQSLADRPGCWLADEGHRCPGGAR